MSLYVDSEAHALEIDEFDANPKLAYLVSPRFALRYHALPIAESDGRVTIVAANPGDRNLQVRVQREIGRPLQLVKANPSTIDRLLAELWPEFAHRSLRIAVLVRGYRDTTLIQFGRTLGSWLRSDEIQVESLPDNRRKLNAFLISSSYDLVILDAPSSDGPAGKLKSAINLKSLSECKSTLLLARHARWPVNKLVCILQGQPSDLVSARWVARLAHTCECWVEVMVIVPPVPLMYAGMSRMEISLDEILRGNSLSGRYLRRSIRYLANWDIRSSMRLLQGFSPLQIEADLLEHEPDLIVISRLSRSQFLNGFMNELVEWLSVHSQASILLGRCSPAQGKVNHA